MTHNQWSDSVLILEMRDEPDFSEDTDALLGRLATDGDSLPDVIVDLQAVNAMNSSNLGALIEARKLLREKERRMIICNISDAVWSTMLATGLDRVFHFTEDVTTALATLVVEE